MVACPDSITKDVDNEGHERALYTLRSYPMHCDC